MDYRDSRSDSPAGPPRKDALPRKAEGVKIMVVGGFGVGKTTMVSSVSEIKPLSTEEVMTQASVGIDHAAGAADGKSTTTVALDFGRITINDQLILYLFGTPGQERFWFLWNGLFEGALGAVVLVDSRDIEVCFEIITRLEDRRVPFIVAFNTFDNAPSYTEEDLRAALKLQPSVPLITCDARDPYSSRDALLTLMNYLHTLSATQESA
jgi:signal recognition particle receptor subunit beta